MSERLNFKDFVNRLTPLQLSRVESGVRILVPCYCDDYSACRGWVAIMPDEVESHMEENGRPPSHVGAQRGE